MAITVENTEDDRKTLTGLRKDGKPPLEVRVGAACDGILSRQVITEAQWKELNENPVTKAVVTDWLDKGQLRVTTPGRMGIEQVVTP